MSNSCVSVAILTPDKVIPCGEGLIAKWAQTSDHAEADRRANPEMSRRFLLGRSLVRALLSTRTQTSGQQCRIVTDTDGKPFVMLGSGKSGPAISISHSGKIIVAATSPVGPIGIDVEYRRLNRSFDDIAAFGMGPQEERAARQSPEAFYRIWCLREAMSKATGRGLREATNKIDRVIAGPDQGAWEADIGTGRWLLAYLSPVKHYSLAIAIIRPKPTRNIEWTESSVDLWFPSKELP